MCFSSFLEQKKHKEYYPHQSVDSKNSVNLGLLVDASADRSLTYGTATL